MPEAIAWPTTDQELSPGRYFIDVQSDRYTFTVPAVGWQPSGDGPGKGDHENDPPDFGGLFIWGRTGPAQAVCTEPCDWQGSAITPGPTADDLATAIAALDGFETSEPTDVLISGYAGKRLQLNVPDEVTFAACDDGEYRSIEGRFYQLPGQVDDIRILDVAGARHYFYTSYDPGASAETQTQLEQMVDSLEITPDAD